MQLSIKVSRDAQKLDLDFFSDLDLYITQKGEFTVKTGFLESSR